MNDVRKVIYVTIIGFLGMLGLWFSIIYVSSCGFTFTCYKGDLLVDRTPIPTLIPGSHSDAQMDVVDMPEFDKCQIAARDLVGVWVSAEAPETDSFTFEDVDGQACEGKYADDIQPLFVENGVWETASVGCISCHNSDLTDRSSGLDMSSYGAISGSGILGDTWEDSKLNVYLDMSLTAAGHSPEMPGGNPLIYAGMVTTPDEETTPIP
jgi:hypothetical protein